MGRGEAAGSLGSARPKERRLLMTDGGSGLQPSPVGPQGGQFGNKSEFTVDGRESYLSREIQVNLVGNWNHRKYDLQGISGADVPVKETKDFSK